MTLAIHEFTRCLLLHVLPGGFHRIRHYGLLTNTVRKQPLAQTRELLQVPVTPPESEAQAKTENEVVSDTVYVCPQFGAAMVIIERNYA